MKCAMNPQHFIETYVYFYAKDGDRTTVKLFPHQLTMLKDVQSYPFSTFFKYRQAGCTTLALAWMLYCLVFSNEKEYVLASGTLAQSNGMMDTLRGMMGRLPRFLRPIPVIGHNSKRRILFESGNYLSAVNISNDGVRGSNPDLLIIDEFMYAEKMDNFMASVMGALSIGAEVIAISSPRFGRESHRISSSSHVRCFQWYQDPRFNTDLWWEQEIHDQFGNNVGSEIRRNVPEAEHVTLLREGYLPHSSWSQKLREAVMNDELASEHFNSDFYGQE